MTETQVFLPTGTLLNASRKWILFLLLLPLFAVIIHLYAPELIFTVPVFAIITIIALLRTKQPVKVALSPRQKTLQYTYKNGWGRQRTVTVDLSTAGGHYEFEQISRNTWGWHLLLYNGNYFRNRVSVQQRERGGFTKRQLDEMVAVVHQCRAGTLSRVNP